MNRGARWVVASGLAVAAFALAWWVCAGPLHRDEGISIGIASAALAIVIVIAGWWAGLERKGTGVRKGPGGESGAVNQVVEAGGDAYVAGRDQVIVNKPRKGQ